MEKRGATTGRRNRFLESGSLRNIEALLFSEIHLILFKFRLGSDRLVAGEDLGRHATKSCVRRGRIYAIPNGEIMPVPITTGQRISKTETEPDDARQSLRDTGRVRKKRLLR